MFIKEGDGNARIPPDNFCKSPSPKKRKLYIFDDNYILHERRRIHKRSPPHDHHKHSHGHDKHGHGHHSDDHHPPHHTSHHPPHPSPKGKYNFKFIWLYSRFHVNFTTSKLSLYIF